MVAPGGGALGAGVNTVKTRFAPLSPLGMAEFGGIQGDWRPDVTHCLHFPTPFPAHHPLVITLHDLTPLTVPGVMPSRTRRFAYRWFNQRAARFADAIVTPSAFTATQVEQRLPLAAGKTHVTLEGADDFAGGPHATLTGALAQAADAPYILSMGSTRTHKDLPTLVRAFARIASTHPELRLLLAGPEVPGYLAQAGLPEELAGRAAFTGPVTDSELRTLYAGAAVFAFPSLAEGFGLPPLEAMSLGAPVVCSSAASLPEVVGDAALTFSPGDDAALAKSIDTVLADAGLRAAMITAGRTRAELLTWAAAAERTVEIYRKLHRD